MAPTIMCLGISAWAYENDEKPENRLASEVTERCESAKEYITTVAYLRDKKELGLDEKSIRKTAERVSKGCTGAARRFVKVFELLLKAEAGPRGSLKISTDFAQKGPEFAETFLKVFTRSYLAEYLDLDYQTSFKLAKNLSVNYSGNPKIAAKDFLKLVDFCSDEKNSGLSKPTCGIIAGRVIKRSGKFHARIAEEFIKSYNFMTSEKGPAVTTVQALKFSEKLVAQGPEAVDNFISMFEFATDNDGLQLSTIQAIRYSGRIAKATWVNTKGPLSDPRKTNLERVPASTSDFHPDTEN